MLIERKNFKPFATDAAIDQIAQIGSLRSGTPTFSKDPNVIQALANYSDGWFGIAMGDNSPAMEDMNAIQFVFAYMIAMILGSGVAEWEVGTTYSVGSIINVQGNLYVSLQDNNTGHPYVESAWWAKQGNKFRTITTNANISPLDNYVRVNGAGLTVTLPNVTIVPLGQEITIKNITSSVSDSSITIATTSSQKIDKFDNLSLLSAANVGGSSLIEESVTLIAAGTRWEIK